MSSKLFTHIWHPHQPRNVNDAAKSEQEKAGFNTRIAVFLTHTVGTMQTAYAFACLALIGLAAILGFLSPVVVLLVAWFSQTFLQLVFLPILSVGQNVLGRHQELMAEETYQTTQKIYADIEQLAAHLNAQDQVLLDLQTRLEKAKK